MIYPSEQLVGLDTETALIARGRLAPSITCMSTYHLGRADLYTYADSNIVDGFMWRAADSPFIVGHNIAYDMAVLMSQYPWLTEIIFGLYERGKILDTMQAQRMLDIAEGRKAAKSYSLATVAARWGFTKDADDPWRLRYAELRDTPLEQWPQEAKAYAIKDAQVPVDILVAMQRKHPPEWLADLPNQTYTGFCLHLSSCWGVHTDPLAVGLFEGRLRDELETIKYSLIENGLLRRKSKKPDAPLVRSTKAAQQRMVSAVGENKFKRTDTGQVALDEDACIASGDPILKQYAEWTSHKTLLARVEVLKQGFTEPLQSEYVNPIETGRTACRHPRPPLIGDQLQNAPKTPGYRECYAPSPGNVFILADFGGMELATIAQACLLTVGHSRMAEMINDGVDLHAYLAAAELHISYDDFLDGYKNGNKQYASARQRAKPGNFGFWGGMGPRTLVEVARKDYGVHLTLAEATRLRDLVRRTYPEMRAYHRGAGRLAIGGGVMETLITKRIRGGCNFRDIANGFFQSLGADAANRAIQRVVWETMTGIGPLRAFRLWLFIHDEPGLEGPEALAHEAAMQLKDVMESGFREIVKDVRCTTDPVITRRWSKEAKQVWQNGRLVPWEWTL